MSTWKDGPEDGILVEAAVKGDEGAFAELIRRHKRKVLNLAARFARDRGELDDVAQETFVKAYLNLGGYRGEAPFEHWLMRIAVRACYDLLRRRGKQSRDVPLEDIEGTLRAPDTGGAEAMEAKEILDRALCRLRPDERLVITLMELSEKTVSETAALTGLSEANVKVKAFRARKALKKILEMEDEDGRQGRP